MVSLTSCLQGCAPRFATPVTLGRPNLAEGIAKTAVLLGFETSLGRGLMPWEHGWNALVTEMDPSGGFVYRQGVLEVMRQQGKTVDLLALMVAYGLRRPGTQIAYSAQKRLDARKRLLDSWWPRIKRSKLGPPLIDVRRDRKSTRLNSSHANISYAVFCLKKNKYSYTSEPWILRKALPGAKEDLLNNHRNLKNPIRVEEDGISSITASTFCGCVKHVAPTT